MKNDKEMIDKLIKKEKKELKDEKKCIVCGKHTFYGLVCSDCHYSGKNPLFKKK